MYAEKIIAWRKNCSVRREQYRPMNAESFWPSYPALTLSRFPPLGLLLASLPPEAPPPQHCPDCRVFQGEASELAKQTAATETGRANFAFHPALNALFPDKLGSGPPPSSTLGNQLIGLDVANTSSQTYERPPSQRRQRERCQGCLWPNRTCARKGVS